MAATAGGLAVPFVGLMVPRVLEVTNAAPVAATQGSAAKCLPRHARWTEPRVRRRANVATRSASRAFAAGDPRALRTATAARHRPIAVATTASPASAAGPPRCLGTIRRAHRL